MPASAEGVERPVSHIKSRRVGIHAFHDSTQKIEARGSRELESMPSWCRSSLVREPHVSRRLQFLAESLACSPSEALQVPCRKGTRVLSCLLLAGLLGNITGCSGDEGTPDATASEATASGDSSSGSAAKNGTKPIEAEAKPSEQELVTEVPEGTAEELFDFMAKREIEELGQESQPEEGVASDGKPTEPDPVEQGVRLRRLMRTRIVACDKIMSKEVPEETRVRALGIKFDALRTLAALDPEAVGPSFQEFIDQMLASGNPLIERMAKATRFQGHVNDYLTSGKESPDKLLDELRQLLENQEAGPETLSAARDAMGWLLESGNIDTSAAGLRLLGERFQAHADENMSAEARSLFSQAIQLQLQQQMRQIDEKKEGAIEGLLQKIQELLQPEKLDPNALGYATQSAQFLEFTGHTAEALKVYEFIGTRFKGFEDATVETSVNRGVDLARKRLKLIGQPLQLEGVTLKGDAFDWSTYRGKWVLVVFWTTWQNDVTKEIDRIREAVRAYQDPAVDVVLINLDDDRNALERFLKQNPVGFKVLVQPDPNAAGFENPNAVRCGVEAVPFILLATPEGTVADIHLMGPRLEQVLSEKVKK